MAQKAASVARYRECGYLFSPKNAAAGACAASTTCVFSCGFGSVVSGGHEGVAVSVLGNLARRREREVITRHHGLVGDDPVEQFAARCLGRGCVLIEGRLPARSALREPRSGAGAFTGYMSGMPRE